MKILFKSSLEITSEQVVEHGRVATAKQTYDDLVFLDQRHARAEMYRRMCHSVCYFRGHEAKALCQRNYPRYSRTNIPSIWKSRAIRHYRVTKHRIPQEITNHSLFQDSSRYIEAFYSRLAVSYDKQSSK